MNEMMDFIGVEKALLLKGEQENLPVNGSLELTPMCNLRCKMCYVRLSAEELEKRGALCPVSEWLRIAGELKEAGTLFLMLSGGEPLLYPGFRELYAALKNMGFILTVNTNGTLLDEEWADFFLAHKPRRMNITLYGASGEEYEALCGDAFGCDRAVNAIRLLSERRIPVKVNFSAMPENYDRFSSVLSFCQDKNIPVNADSYMMPPPGGADGLMRISPCEAAHIEYENIKQQVGEENLSDYALERAGQRKPLPETGAACMAGRCSFSIDWQGNLRPCALQSAPSLLLKNKPFKEAFHMLSEALDKPLFPSECRSCEQIAWCRICPASALRETGGLEEPPKRLCHQAKALESCFAKKSLFSVGGFCFDVNLASELPVPENFNRFAVSEGDAVYHYHFLIEDGLFPMKKEPDLIRGDCQLFFRGTRETRLLTARGDGEPYALCEETGESVSFITIDRSRLSLFSLDTVFTSLFALEKRLYKRNRFLFHCTFLSYRSESILFTGPSGAGKSTQGGLWEEHRGARIVNGDRALLSFGPSGLIAEGFPVCGSSEICFLETRRVRCIVVVRQAKENRVEPVKGVKAWSLLYPQLMVNSWNRDFVEKASTFLERVLSEIPVYELFCDISEGAVDALDRVLYGEDEMP